ncbi:cytochrome c oxidase assembly factor CtaG [Bacillus sp. HMF5848]|uniref:cytochrome c oxidase assembly factor CtaG n=1 Tax=Bacillus sp. HMF5848 TaxID=2495421 RepID=UPI000F789D53|nr:cytochrome c oxidase assembly factor CtaG [Bacillus sp. HMF5848]RSK26903.1 cytochrome c oxidase assembly factor CtaG [Bacillus sp. HMF5848]
MGTLSIFGFRAMWSPEFLLFTVIVLFLYFMLIGPWRYKFKNHEKVSPLKIFYFSTALILLYIIKGSPVDLLGHLMFSVHMTQMAFLYLAIPPLLILGLPNYLLEAIVDRPIVSPMLRFFTKPVLALILFNGLFSFYHIPFIFDTVKTDPLLHAAVTILIFLSALIMWFPLTNQLPKWNTLVGVKKIGYVFADGVLLTPACALIIFANTPLYATYYDPAVWMEALSLCVPGGVLTTLSLTGPEMFMNMPLMQDQQLGGVIMKVFQEIVFICILGYVFFEWVKRERVKDQEELNAYLNPQAR